MEKIYREAANILKKAISKLGSIRTFVYSSDIKNKKILLKLCCETAKYREYLEHLLRSVSGQKLLNSLVIRNNRYLALVILYELTIGHGLSKCEKKFKNCINSFSSGILNEVNLLKTQGVTARKMATKSNVVKIPRYVRINTLRISLKDVIKQLEADGFIVELLEKNISQKDFCRKISTMTQKNVFLDSHVENLLIFTPEFDLHNFWLTNEGLILQDKASCLPSVILNPKKNSYVIDACAAPGMKTSHLSAILNNTGKIFAFDRDKQRLTTLQKFLSKENVNNVITENIDFLRVKNNDKLLTNVEYALVDPPCSGSGMTKRGAFLDEFEKPDEKRLRSLANLQTMILKHALSFPNLKKCVYSTCSMHEMENEGVVQEVLLDESISARYQLTNNLLPNWTHRGLNKYSFGNKCIRASPNESLTNGFFIAVLERIVN